MTDPLPPPVWEGSFKGLHEGTTFWENYFKVKCLIKAITEDAKVMLKTGEMRTSWRCHQKYIKA